MIKTIAIVIAVLIAGVLIFATTKPDTFTVQRSATIKAPPERISRRSTAAAGMLLRFWKLLRPLYGNG